MYFCTSKASKLSTCFSDSFFSIASISRRRMRTYSAFVSSSTSLSSSPPPAASVSSAAFCCSIACSSSGVSICTFVLVSSSGVSICTFVLVRRRLCLALSRAALRLRCQHLYFCASKASKRSTKPCFTCVSSLSLVENTSICTFVLVNQLYYW